MSDAEREQNPQYFVRSLQQYVLAPVSTAARVVDEERTEVRAERDAYREFSERLAAIDSAPPTPPDRATRFTSDTATTDRIQRVRTAFRETVLDTPHYDDVYDESLLEHLAGEFGPEVADGLRPESSMSLSAPYKQKLGVKTARALSRRDNFLDTLDDEARSIESARSALAEVFGPLDTTIIPEWHCESFTERLDDVARHRQRTIRERDSVPQFDEHSVCTLLYDDEPWTYPVLTAVARTRETVSFERSASPGSTNSPRL